MKKVLVTGAAGTLGKKVIKYLLSEGKYEVTAVDLKSRNNHKILRKYKKRMNIIYADVTDANLMEPALKESDYVIHLAGVNPPLADLNPNLSYEIDYKGTENIVRILNFYNPSCHLLFASTATVYGEQENNEVSVSTKIDSSKLGAYAKYKYESEELIKEKLNNYSIYRLPVILCNPHKGNYIFNYNAKETFEITTDEDAAYMFVAALDKIEKLNKKIFNVGGGKYSIISGKDLNNEIIRLYGLSSKYIKTSLFIDKNVHGYIFKDSDKLDEILNYRNDSIASYVMRVKRKEDHYFIRRILGVPFIKKNKETIDKEK